VRTLAIKHGVRERSTAARLRAAGGAAGVPPEHIEAIIGAHRLFLRALLEQQLIDSERGVPLSNGVEIKRLSPSRRRELRDALGVINLMALFLR
jgi:signal-transduction protein with cAMP-binding, CBS, and nucleotidyltransferase domain